MTSAGNSRPSLVDVLRHRAAALCVAECLQVCAGGGGRRRRRGRHSLGSFPGRGVGVALSPPPAVWGSCGHVVVLSVHVEHWRGHTLGCALVVCDSVQLCFAALRWVRVVVCREWLSAVTAVCFLLFSASVPPPLGSPPLRAVTTCCVQLPVCTLSSVS